MAKSKPKMVRFRYYWVNTSDGYDVAFYDGKDFYLVDITREPCSEIVRVVEGPLPVPKELKS